MDIHIKGVQKVSLIDYPGKISTIVFLNKCNFRCGFCHNPELVLNEHDKTFPDITCEEFFSFLKGKKKWLDAVCITGGEPTLHPGLVDFIKEIKSVGLLVKLDTNGTNPEIIRKVIDEKIVDYIAMDIKNSPEKYESTCNAKVDIKSIEKSIRLIIDSGNEGLIDYEFRTTMLPRLHTKEDILKIKEWLKGAKKYSLQQFKTEQSLVDDAFKDDKSFAKQDIEDFKKILEDEVLKVEIKG